MKKITLLFSFIAFISCKAQSIISIEEASKYYMSAEGLPESVQYVKDINKRLDQFTGTWKGSYEGKSYEFRFVKREYFGSYSVKWDEIIGRVSIKKDNQIIFNTINIADDQKTFLRGSNLQNKVYVMYFAANADCNDSGDVFIEVSKSNTNQMTLYFMRDNDILVNIEQKCPNYSTYVPLLPQDKMILVKQ